RQQDGAGVIDDPAVDFLRYASVVAAITGLEVKDGNSPSGRGNRTETAVGVAQHHDPIGAMALERGIHLLDDVADLRAQAGPMRREVFVRLAQLQLTEEQLAELVIEVLTRVNQDVIAHSIERGN